ncbi:MAG: cytochrome c-type biogenesis protein [Pseudomonadota bacterium]
MMGASRRARCVQGFAAILLIVMSLGPAAAVQPEERLSDPALEARARALSKDVRCLVCQNESIDASNADLARDLRLLVRERLTAGDSDEEVRAFLVDRYGDYVLLTPPMRPSTWALWAGPFLLLAAAVAALAVRARPGSDRAAHPHAAPLDPDETARLNDLMSAAPPGADERRESRDG